MTHTIHLIRHGRVADYRTDEPLIPQGREETLALARELAETVEPGETIRLFSSPARRARETAEILQTGLREALATRTVSAAINALVAVDDRLQNNQMFLGGLSYDPMTILVDVARWRYHENPSPKTEAFLAYQIEFWNAADPVAYWLAHPSPLSEAPEAVAGRTHAFLAERLANSAPRPCRDICVTHSANMRSFLRTVFGADPGPPPFSGLLTVKEGRVIYQGQEGKFPAE